MARRRNLSELLESRYVCPVSWDDMQGVAERRFCGRCRCEVFDFAQMEPRAVKARLEASRGQLCARVTREQGRLRMLAPPSPPAAEPRKAERAPAVAAGLFGAWLTLAAAQASAAPGGPAFVSSSAAEPRDDGDAPAAGHEAVLPGVFSDAIEVTAELAVPVESVTVGFVVAGEKALRELFDDSDLVFAGRVGSSEVLAVNDGIAEVRTVLRVARRFKGLVRDRFVTYRHALPVEAFDPELQEPPPELTPGSMVVAFLSPAEDEAGRPVFETTGYSGLRGVAADELAAYSARLDDLAALRRVAGPQGELEPAGLMEWLVAAAEDPLTRKENTSQEILSALEEFAAAPEGQEAEASPGLGAQLSEAHAARLAAALLATREMGVGELGLFRLVRRVDRAAAALWLVETLRSSVLPEGSEILGPLEEFAETLEEKTSRAFLSHAGKRLRAMDALLPDDRSPEAEEAWRRQRQDLARTLFAELAALLEKTPS